MWALENLRLLRDRRQETRQAFALADYQDYLMNEADAVRELLSVQRDTYLKIQKSLWKPPRDPAEPDRIWDGRDGLLRLAGALVRVLRPAVVVETGVARGYTSATILAVMEENNRGRLYSVDLPPLEVDKETFVGQVVPETLKRRWTLRLGPSRRILPQVVRAAAPIDLFLHDSDHTYSSQLEEYRTAWPFLRSGGVVLSDDVTNPAFIDFAAEVGVRPLLVHRRADSAYGLVKKP